ncbi:MAG: aldose epimerase family protein [Faecalibacterium sp.]
MASITSKPFGVTKKGEAVTAYTLENSAGLQVTVLDYGCIIKDIIVPAKQGPVDVALGHDTLAGYEAASAWCGAFVGRYANRIENASFTLNGKTYPLEKNNGNNHLHGCFAQKMYDVKCFGDSILFEAFSPDGEDGFPGNVKIAVRYTLTQDNAFRMEYRVTTDADTYINLTNHGYFNLDGEGTIDDQKLRLYAAQYLEGNDETCPTGRILPVENTVMDFTTGKRIGQDLHKDDPTLSLAGGGYDHCYVIDRERGASQSICAWASSEKTGISMKIYTTEPGVQFYTGNGLQDCGALGKGGIPMVKHCGFALETQHYPCSPSHPEFPSTLLRAGKVYRSTTTIRFFTGKQCGRL